MIITCPQCGTRFELEAARIPEGGAKARCSRCRHIFELPRPVVSAPLNLSAESIAEVPKEKAPPSKKLFQRRWFLAGAAGVAVLAGAALLTRNIWSAFDSKTAQNLMSTARHYVGLRADKEGTFALENVHGYYVENVHLNKIFVIEGQAVSRWKEPRSFLRIRGALLDGKGGIVSEKIIYGGNLLSEKDLKEMDGEAIGKSLSSQFGVSLTNVNIRPDQSVPFMIVFTELPASPRPGNTAGEPSGKPGEGLGLADFVVEVVGSQKGVK